MRPEQTIANLPLLRRVLAADAALTGLTALAMCLLAGPLAAFTALPPTLLLVAGLVLLPYVAWIAWLAKRPTRGKTRAVVAINLLWAADCLLLLASGWVTPNAFGVAFVLAQALATAVFAALAILALGRAPVVRTA